MAAPLLAEVLGGTAFLGFICAVAFATILAVVAGLTLSGAAALSHDLWVNVVRGGHAPRARAAAWWRASRRSSSASAPIAARHRLQGPERRLHGRPRLRDRRQRQLPGAGAVDLLEDASPPGARCCSILFGTIGTLLLIYLGPTIQFDLLGPKVAGGRQRDVAAACQTAYQDMIMSQWWYFPLKNPCIYHDDRRLPGRHRRVAAEAGEGLRSGLRGNGASRDHGRHREGGARRMSNHAKAAVRRGPRLH